MSRFSKVDTLFHNVIFKERPNKCERCGKTTTLAVAHILSKGAHPRLRYHKPNVLILCFRCHFHFAHKSPLEFTEWVERYKGKGLLDNLRLAERMLPKTDLKMLMIVFREELNGR